MICLSITFEMCKKNSPVSGGCEFRGQSASSVPSSQLYSLSHRCDIGMQRLISQENSSELHSENVCRTKL